MMPEPAAAPSSSSSASSSPELPREIEWQLASANLERVRHWLQEHPRLEGLSIEPLTTVELHDTYLDTQDFRMFRAGFALRMRSHARAMEATLKALVSARKDVADRVELTEPLPGSRTAGLARLAGPVGTRVRAVAGRRALQPLFEVHTRRQRFAVRGNGADLGEIALDETVIHRPRGEERARVQRVEVEAQGDGLEPLQGLVNVLTKDCELRRAAVSKFEMGLKSMRLDPRPPAMKAAQIDSAMATGEAILATLRPLLAAWLSHEPAARLGDDPGELHSLRISARRMDAIVGLFAPYLPRALPGIRPTLKGLLRTLGAVRDHDLQLMTLATFREELSPQERPGLLPLQRHLEAGRERVRRRMLQALDAPATAASLERLAKSLASTRAPVAKGTEPLASVAPLLISGHFRRLRKAFRRMEEPPSMDDYHQARRRVKRLRYALEPVADIYGRPAQQMLRSLRRLQEQLGIQQDAHVARTHLAQLAADPPEGFLPLTLFLMGRLAERQAPPDPGRREEIEKAWRKLRGPRWKALQERMVFLDEHATDGSDIDVDA